MTQPDSDLPDPRVPPELPPSGGWWGRFLAATRLSLTRVCAESATMGEHDYHNHKDSDDSAPWHVKGRRRCRRCGKWFRPF